MPLEELLDNVKIAAIVCNQWGDSGKGKFVDFFSEWADVIIRGTGGNNAGHTVVANGKERVFHLIPSGIIYDEYGKVNMLGNGMVIDVKMLCRELESLSGQGLTYNNLRISKDAHVIMPYHVEEDIAKNQSQSKGGIGSTGRGIGPCYKDKIARQGIIISDLLNRDLLYKKIEQAKSRYPLQIIETEKIISELEQFTEIIKPLISDTITETHKAMREEKKILIEGAQGLLLGIEHGTYPYVTSSDCSINGSASGAGIPASAIDLPLGLVKFPFMTRVGGGPFPTEMGGKNSEEKCASEGQNLERELVDNGIPYFKYEAKIYYERKDEKIISLINSEDELKRGVGIRLAAGEYGATTGRPRRVGWTDAVAAKYAVGINGPLFVLTKPDSIEEINSFNICYSYTDGKNVYEDFNRDSDFLRGVSPVYKKYPGYSQITGARTYDSLPKSLKEAIDDFEKFTCGRAAIISVGPSREETIVR